MLDSFSAPQRVKWISVSQRIYSRVHCTFGQSPTLVNQTLYARFKDSHLLTFFVNIWAMGIWTFIRYPTAKALLKFLKYNIVCCCQSKVFVCICKRLKCESTCKLEFYINQKN